MIKAVLFDLGNTLIHQQIDDKITLDKMDLIPYEETHELLDSLQGKYKLGLLSNTETTDSSRLMTALDRMDLSRYFDCVLTSVDLGIKKPAPLMFNTILERMQVPASLTVMVGNDVEKDIAGAQLLGLKTIFYSRMPEDIESLRVSEIKPDRVAGSLSEISTIISNWP